MISSLPRNGLTYAENLRQSAKHEQGEKIP